MLTVQRSGVLYTLIIAYMLRLGMQLQGAYKAPQVTKRMCKLSQFFAGGMQSMLLLGMCNITSVMASSGSHRIPNTLSFRYTLSRAEVFLSFVTCDAPANLTSYVCS